MKTKYYLWFVVVPARGRDYHNKLNELFPPGNINRFFERELKDFEILPVGSKIELVDEELGSISFLVTEYVETRNLVTGEINVYVNVDIHDAQLLSFVLVRGDGYIKKFFKTR